MFNMYEMASLSMKSTGLPLRIYISAKGNSKHGPRIKVSSLYGDKLKPDKLFVVTISDTPKVIGDVDNVKSNDISKIISFVIDNKELLIAYWEEILDTDELIELIVKDK